MSEKKPRTLDQVDQALDLVMVDLDEKTKKLEDLVDQVRKMTEQLVNLNPRVTTLEQKTANGEKPMGPSVTARLDQIEATLKGAEKIIGTGRMLEVVPPDHVLSPTRRGLAEYEDARTKLLKQKPGEILTLKHLGKSIDVGYDDGRILLRQAKVLG
jgi:hypothetical protein